MDRVSGRLVAEARVAVSLIHHGLVLAGRRVRRTELGEGVISAAIAVLVMAFLGAAMWFAFNGTMHTAQSKVDTNVNSIGSGSGGGGGGGTGAGGTGGTGGTGGSGLP
jgi:hypothetical protein